jgi:hypothetical protein
MPLLQMAAGPAAGTYAAHNTEVPAGLRGPNHKRLTAATLRYWHEASFAL